MLGSSFRSLILTSPTWTFWSTTTAVDELYSVGWTPMSPPGTSRCSSANTTSFRPQASHPSIWSSPGVLRPVWCFSPSNADAALEEYCNCASDVPPFALTPRITLSFCLLVGTSSFCLRPASSEFPSYSTAKTFPSLALLAYLRILPSPPLTTSICSLKCWFLSEVAQPRFMRQNLSLIQACLS